MMFLEAQSGLAAASDGMSIAIVGLGIVFAVLIFLAVVFLGMQKYMTSQAKKELEKQGKDVGSMSDDDVNVPADVNAAISTALYLYFSEQGEQESGVITIKHTQKRYSPWNSKIYGLNNLNFPK